MSMLHKYKLIRDSLTRRLTRIVVIILIAPMIEESPAKCREKIQKSTLCVT